MAAPAPKSKSAPVKKKKSMQRWKLYTVSGDKMERKNKFCPKCGADSVLANHKNRLTCGKCKYVEFKKRE